MLDKSSMEPSQGNRSKIVCCHSTDSEKKSLDKKFRLHSGDFIIYYVQKFIYVCLNFFSKMLNYA